MKIICDTCGAKYSIADEKVRGKVFKIRCKKCSEIIVVRGTTDSASEAGESQAAAAAAGGYGGDVGGADGAIWHVVLDGENQGPYTADQVAQFVAAGQLDHEAYCWRDGFSDWMHLGDVPDLVAAVGGGAPAMAPEAAAVGAAFQDQMPTAAAGSDPYADQYGGGGGYAEGYGGGYEGGYDAGDEAGAFDGGDTQLAPQDHAAMGFTAPDAGAPPSTAQAAVAALFGEAPAQAPAERPSQQAAPAPGAGFAAPSASPQAARGAGHDVGADLFARQDEGGEMFPADSGEDVMTSSPRVDVGRMTGTRNENSVLFSLSNLQALASGPAPAEPVSRSGAPSSFGGASMGGSAAGTTEGSGLIDIRAMAAAAADVGDGGGSVDDLLSIGGGGGFAPTLGAPVLMAQPQESGSKLIYALIGVGALVVIAVAVVAVILLTRPTGPQLDAVAAAAQQQILAPQPGMPGAMPGGESPTAPVVPTIPNDPTGGSAEEPSESGEERGSQGGATGGTKASKRGSGGSSAGGGGGGSSSAPSPAPTGGGSSPAPAATQGSRDLDALLAGAIGGDAPRPTKAPAAAPSGGGDASVPQTLSRSQVQAGMRTVSGAVARCGGGQSGRVTIDIVIAGATGRVSSATVSGSFAGTAIGSCAARAVRGARFPRFRDASLTVRGYPFVLQ